MTDQEINRAVAEARGWTVEPNDVWDGNVWLMEKPPAVCTDPAAWGAFHAELAADGWRVLLDTHDGQTTCTLHRWAPGPTLQRAIVTEPTPGRALALAFLKAVGR
jgi:hypothetical protein